MPDDEDLRREMREMVSMINAYYQYWVSRSTWTCENCQSYIVHETAWQKISAQAHILPKKTFDSVKCEVNNHLHLCPACHMNWDSSWHKAATMPVFELAMVRLESFRHLVIEPLPDALLLAIIAHGHRSGKSL